MSQLSLITIRDWVPGDYNFVKATWIKALRFGNQWFARTEGPSYYKAYSKVLDSLLSTPTVQVAIASLSDEPDVILGYSVYRGTTLDFVYVKKAWRNIGIAKSLVPKTIKKVTHLTETGKSILERYPNVSFDPFSP